MDHPRRRHGWAVLRHLAVPALALAVVATLPAAAPRTAPPAADPLTPVSVTYGEPTGPVVNGTFFSYNDFHGAIDPPVGSGAAVNGTPAGGVEYLATWLKKLRAEARAAGRPTVTVGAGDLIGASPLVSAAFHDEPTIELMDEIGLQVSSVGNHEFDEGVAELIRLTRGGCHPVDGCQDNDGFAGADFTYLAANTIDKRTKLPILPPITVKLIRGEPVGFVGLTLEDTPSIVNPAGIASVTFTDEVETANKWSNFLSYLGIKAQVLLLHEGGQQSPPPTAPGVSDCANFSGPIVPIVAGLNSEFGLVVSGHTHRFYSCSLPNRAGVDVAVTSAGSNGQLITRSEFSIDARTNRFVSVDATNVVVENGVRKADGSGWETEANGTFVKNPALVDPAAKAVADKYRTAVAPIANRVVGSITGTITRTARPNGESPLGDVIADAQLAYTRANGAQLALMNPGGIRADLVATGSPDDVTYGEAFTVQPFNNLVVTQTFTGAQLKDVLEQQFVGFDGQSTQRILQVSAGFAYTYDRTLPAGSRVSGITLNGTPIDPAASYRVTTNDFLANGGDGFTNLAEGTGRATAPGFDVDALVAYLAAGPVAPGPANRFTGVAA